MHIVIGTDHRGFLLKEKVKKELQEGGHIVEDVGAHALNPGDDYPDYAYAVADSVAKDTIKKGIVFCGSGVGVDIVANKVDGIRCGYAASSKEVASARRDDNINVLAIGVDILSPGETQACITAFLTTFYEEHDKYERRIKKISAIEKHE